MRKRLSAACRSVERMLERLSRILPPATGPAGAKQDLWAYGSAIRISTIGWAFEDFWTVRREAAASAAIAHDHPEAIKGAVWAAMANVMKPQASRSTRRMRDEYRDFQPTDHT